MTPQLSPNPETPASDPPPVICPILTLAGETFDRELPELLRHSRNKWVAYHGSRRVGIAASCPDAECLCDVAGIPLYEVSIWCIENQPPFDLIGME